MGADGGTAAKSRKLIVTLAKARQSSAALTRGRSRIERWKNCALTNQRLRKPIVCCGIGNLYNKESLLEALQQAKINKTQLRPGFHHITRYKDVINCNLTMKSGNTAPFVCPFSGANGNGSHRFVCVRQCGCLFAKAALDNLKGDVKKNCLVCEKPLLGTDSYELIPLFGSEEEQDKLRKLLEAREPKKKKKKKKKKKGVKGLGLTATNGNFTTQQEKEMRKIEAQIASRKSSASNYAKLFTSSETGLRKRKDYAFGPGGYNG